MDITKKRRLAEIAYMYYIDGLNQSEIAREYSISRSMVSTMLTEAKASGIVKIRIGDSELYCFDLQREMEAIFGIDKVVITPKLSNSEENLRLRLADGCIDYLNQIVEDDTVIALSWGRTVHAIAARIRSMGKTGLVVTPLVGGIGNEITVYHSNLICDLMAKNLGGVSYGLYAPVFVSSKEIKEVVFHDKNISKVLELSKKSDIALMSIGNITSSAMREMEALGKDDMEALMARGAIGDINTSFFDEKGNIVETELVERTISVTMEELRKIPKIIVVAGGKEKTQAIHAALKNKLMDVLVTDEDTANRILKEY